MERRGDDGNPLMFAWMTIPEFALWGLGVWIGSFFR